MTLTINKLSKQIGNQTILRDISVNIQKGEVFGVLGANNSGKSILLETIAGEKQPDDGSIFLDESELTVKPNEVFLFPKREQATGLKGLFSSLKSNENSSRSLTKSLLGAFEEDRKILLFDNPYEGLDADNKRTFTEKLRQSTKERELVVVIATSDYREIFDVCDTVGILHNGKIIQVGTPKKVYQHPAGIAVASLFGEINLVEVKRITSNKTDIPEFLTIKGEHRISTARIEKKDLGTIDRSLVLAIRPENISLSFGASFPEDNLIKAKISKVKFQGATTIITLDANGLELKALVLRLVGLNIGDECMVGLPPERILVLKD